MDNSCMNSSQDHEKTCCCAITHVDTLGLDSIGANAFTGKSLLGFSGLIAAWWVIYSHLEPFSKFFTHMLSRWWTGFSPESHLGSAVSFFVFETPKVLMLLTLVVFGVGIVRSCRR